LLENFIHPIGFSKRSFVRMDEVNPDLCVHLSVFFYWLYSQSEALSGWTKSILIRIFI